MKDCIFCKIIKNELPSSTIYEDDLIKIIMNINPNTNGINKNKPIITNNIDIASDVLKLLLIFPSIFTSILNTFFNLFH